MASSSTDCLTRLQMDASQLGFAQPFIGEHCYASQELVNLLVSGGAYSNVFDGSFVMLRALVLCTDCDETMNPLHAAGVRELEDIDPTTGKQTKLYGIPTRGDVGCLTLYEHYGYVECGKNLKVPRHPIWVICSESHYSCFFSTHNRCLEGVFLLLRGSPTTLTLQHLMNATHFFPQIHRKTSIYFSTMPWLDTRR